MLALVRFAFISTLLIAPNLSLADEKGTAATASQEATCDEVAWAACGAMLGSGLITSS